MAGLTDLADGGKLTMPSLDGAVGDSSNRELMADARRVLSGNWGMAIAGWILYVVLATSFFVFVMSVLFFVGVTTSTNETDFLAKLVFLNPVIVAAQFLVSGAFAVGFAAFYLGISQEGEARLEKLFIGFRRFWKSLGVYFLYGLLVALWSLLLVVPGIIAAYRYVMAYYIIADDEDCGPLEAISRSKEMMAGNKWKFFCLNLRFIGWSILAAIPCGLGYLWLIPYMQTSFAKFYEDVS